MMNQALRYGVLFGLVLGFGPRPGRAAEIAAHLEGLAPPGWRVRGAVEVYTPDSLYEKINGRSELYLAYEVSAMACVALVPEGGDAALVEIYLYDMQTPLAAFGVFSMERSRGAPAIDLGRQAYHEAGGLYFWKGPYYATLRGAESDGAPAPEVLDLARHLAERLPDRGEPLWGIQLLPRKGLVADSVQYFMGDALALEFLTDTFTAVYAAPEGELTLFLSRQPTAAAARATRDQFIAYLEAYGTDLERTRIGDTDFASADMGGAFDAVFQLGPYVAGATTLPSRAQALAAATDFRTRLEPNVSPPSTPPNRSGEPSRP